MPFAAEPRHAEVSALVDRDVQGFTHAVSNQAIAHTLAKHGNPAAEHSRGQLAVTRADFAKLPQIVAQGTYAAGRPRKFGPPRVEITAHIDGVTYVYIAEVRGKQKRLDLISLWKR